MASPTSPTMPNGGSSRWQDQLSDHCRKAHLQAPVFNIVSDRRGGRTAWSSTVTIQGQNIAARFWYDGQYINNAKEDAAEVALMKLNSQQRPATLQQGQLYASSSYQGSNGTGRGWN